MSFLYFSIKEFASLSRDKVQTEHTLDPSKLPDDEFDTNIHGPWMRRWEIVHHNKHTASLTDEGSSWDSDRPGHKA